MAAVLLHTYSPGPGRGILLNPSPGASPAYHPAALPALVPSNSSLSSSASSSAPGDDYFSSKSSASPSPGPSSSGSPAPRNSTHLHPSRKPRNGSNPSTVRRIRFAPLPEPRRDLDAAEDLLPPVFLDDDAEAPHPHDPQSLSLHSALAAASLSLAAPGDSELCRRTRSLPPSVSNSPSLAKKALPSDSLLLDPAHSAPASSSPSSAAAADPNPGPPSSNDHTTAPSELGHDWDVLPPSSPALASLSLPTPDSPRKAGKWSKMLKPLLGRSHNHQAGGAKGSLARTSSAEEVAALAGGERGRGAFLGLAGSRNSSRSRDASVSRERDCGRGGRDSDFGLPLHRWTSEGQPVLPVSKKKKHSLFGVGGGGGGVPLGRTQSLTSLSSKDEKKGAAARPAVVVTNGGRKQQRMLNGRVYGAKRNANPFANVRSEEPEFVEWGYGGMGSVKASAGQSAIWQRVQKGSVAIGGGDGESAAWGGGTRTSADEDDGSGMAWLKKRKEQREKARAEAEKAAAEAAAAAEHSEGHDEQGDADASTTTTTPADADADAAQQTAALTSSPTPSAPDALHAPPHEEHITQTVNIPATHHRHHHSHSHSHSHSHHHHGHHSNSLSLSLSPPHPERRESADTARGVPFATLPALSPLPMSSPGQELTSALDEGDGTPVPAVASLADADADAEADGERTASSASSVSGESEESASAKDPNSPSFVFGEGSVEDDDEEEDLEEFELTEERKTALSAGMEKIARHHKEMHEHAAAGMGDVPVVAAVEASC
ncbi:hypothetical protein C2E23DRAFT_281542 [Lenzites betulinus]|nr:hypothetical protein C2E23DRAFT_281542 [Lenzites betulinus]